MLDFLLELAPERTNVEIVIAGEDGPARLALRDGKLIHAECSGARGPIAFEKILTYERGQFEVIDSRGVPEKTLDLPITPKVLRQFRRVDVSPTVDVASFGTKTLLQYQSPIPHDLGPKKDSSRTSSRPPGEKRGKLTQTGYSSVPPPAMAEDFVPVPTGGRASRKISSRPPPATLAGPGRRESPLPSAPRIDSPLPSAPTGFAPAAVPRIDSPLPTATMAYGQLGAGRIASPPPVVIEASEPDTGPVPSARLDKSSLVRLEELNEALSSTHHPIPRRDEDPPPAQGGTEEPEAGGGELPRVGRYEVLARLKSGGMGSIYLCRLSGSAGFQRLFAMKVLHQHLTEQEEALDLFFSEARLLAQLHHPNIVGIVDVGSPEQPYLVLDYVEGGSLKELLTASARQMEPGIVLSIVLDALQGLSAAHQLQGESGELLGLVHNDVSPHNLLVGIDGTCRVTDFGIAKARGHASSSQTRGKPSFVAPERILRRRVDQRADLFSMGVVLYQGLTGVDPFLGATSEETLRNVLERTVPPPSETGLRPPPSLDWICLKALAKDPSERFQSAEEMAHQLRRVAAREDLLVAPSTVAHWVRVALAGPLEARRAAAQRAGSSDERRRPTVPPGALPRLEVAHPSSDPPKSSDFNEKTEILSAPPPSSSSSGRLRNFVLYVALALTVGALVLVLLFPDKVQGVLIKEARTPSSDDAWVHRQSDSALQVPSAASSIGAPPEAAGPDGSAPPQGSAVAPPENEADIVRIAPVSEKVVP